MILGQARDCWNQCRCCCKRFISYLAESSDSLCKYNKILAHVAHPKQNLRRPNNLLNYYIERPLFLQAFKKWTTITCRISSYQQRFLKLFVRKAYHHKNSYVKIKSWSWKFKINHQRWQVTNQYSKIKGSKSMVEDQQLKRKKMKEYKSMKNHQQYSLYTFVVMFVNIVVVLSFLSFTSQWRITNNIGCILLLLCLLMLLLFFLFFLL